MTDPDELRGLVESYLAELALTPELGGLEESMRHALAGGGKRRNDERLIKAGCIVSVGTDNTTSMAPEFRRTEKSEHQDPGIGTILAILGWWAFSFSVLAAGLLPLAVFLLGCFLTAWIIGGSGSPLVSRSQRSSPTRCRKSPPSVPPVNCAAPTNAVTMNISSVSFF